MDWTEYLIPAVVFILWILGEVFKGKGEKDKERPSQPTQRSPQRDSDNQEDEVTRRIQEEIRRKIAERRGATQGQRTPEQAAPRYETPRPVVREQHTPPPVRRQEEPTLSSYSDAQAQIERNRKQAREAKKQLQQTRKKEKLAAKNASAPSPTSGGSVRADIITMLSNRSQAQRAFVLQEVLGTPIGMRRGGESQNLWER